MININDMNSHSKIGSLLIKKILIHKSGSIYTGTYIHTKIIFYFNMAPSNASII